MLAQRVVYRGGLLPFHHIVLVQSMLIRRSTVHVGNAKSNKLRQIVPQSVSAGSPPAGSTRTPRAA